MDGFDKIISLLGVVTKTAKRLRDTREEAKVNEIAIYLQGIILDLQSELMLIQSSYQDILREKEDLKVALSKQEKWNDEKSQYWMRQVGLGVFVYSLKPEHRTEELDHWLCTHCYNKGQKSIMQHTQPINTFFCPNCANKIRVTKTLGK